MKIEIEIKEAGKVTWRITGAVTGGVFTRIEALEVGQKVRNLMNGGPLERMFLDLMIGEPVGGIPGGRRPWMCCQPEHPAALKKAKAPKKAPAKRRKK